MPKNQDRQAGADRPDETSIRNEITEAVLMAGVAAFNDYRERRKSDDGLSKFDMVSDIYVAMRRAAARKA